MPQKIEIRDTRNGDWFWVNTAVNACPHITPYDKVVYNALCTFSGYKEIRPSFETIAKRASVSIRKAKKSIKKLIQVGYLTILQGGGRGKCNVYNLLKASKGCTMCTVSKQCTVEPKTVHATTINRARCALHIDRYIDKEKDKEFLKKNSGKPVDNFIPLRQSIEQTRLSLKRKGIIT